MLNIGLDKDIDTVITALNNKIDTDRLIKLENNINDTITEVTLDIQETKNIINNLDIGVTSFNGNKGDVTYTAPVTSVNGATGTVSVGTVRTVNGVSADEVGNVVLEEVGTNYIRYTNGMQVCFWRESIPGGGASQVYTIPKAYKTAPLLVYTGHYGHINNSAVTNTTVTMGNNFSDLLTCGLVTIGFWK